MAKHLMSVIGHGLLFITLLLITAWAFGQMGGIRIDQSMPYKALRDDLRGVYPHQGIRGQGEEERNRIKELHIQEYPYAHMYKCTHGYFFIYTYLHIYECRNVYLQIYTYIVMYISPYVHMHPYVHIYICTFGYDKSQLRGDLSYPFVQSRNTGIHRNQEQYPPILLSTPLWGVCEGGGGWLGICTYVVMPI